MTNEMANRMSLFYAQATPMLKTLSDITTQFVSQVSFAVDSCAEWFIPGTQILLRFYVS